MSQRTRKRRHLTLMSQTSLLQPRIKPWSKISLCWHRATRPRTPASIWASLPQNPKTFLLRRSLIRQIQRKLATLKVSKTTLKLYRPKRAKIPNWKIKLPRSKRGRLSSRQRLLGRRPRYWSFITIMRRKVRQSTPTKLQLTKLSWHKAIFPLLPTWHLTLLSLKITLWIRAKNSRI